MIIGVLELIVKDISLVKSDGRDWRYQIPGQHSPIRSNQPPCCIKLIVPVYTKNHALTSPQQQLKDYGYHIRGDHRHLQVLYRLEQPDCLRLERPLGGMASHVIHVVESVSCQESFSVQHQNSVDK
jgi:hypothetical protein